MACLNLPPEICYKPENMYIAGIINSPGEPHLTDLNHYMQPLVDDMELSWDRGVHFSKTAMFPTGRMTRSAIAAVVCDLPAARKAAQLSSHSSHFYCSICRTDFDVWEQHDVAVLRQNAIQWKSAPTAKDHDRLFAAHGVHWSELWCLPYWDTTWQLVVDSMHCILERLVQCHIHDILDLLTQSATTKPVTQSVFSFNFQQAHSDHNMVDKEVKQAQIHTLLTAPIYDEIDEEIQNQLKVLKGKLLQKNLKPLKFALIQWVGWPMTNGQAVPLKLATPEVMLYKVIPSWINSVPPNFGDATAGTLKADEWHTLSTIHLPLALISLWGAGMIHPNVDIATKLQTILDHMMSLFSATMTKARILSYRTYISRYVKDLKAIHPGVEHTTSHHMAIHIYEFLGLFGPIRSWWCFPFKYLIGILQCQPSNHKFGELETTMLQAFIRGAKLRHWLRRPDCPPAIKECSKLFEKAYSSKGYDDLIPHDDVDNFNVLPLPQTFPEELYVITKQQKGVLPAYRKQDGVVYATSSAHLGNSLIQFYPGGRKNVLLGKMTFAVRCQQPPIDDIVDPFKLYPHFPAKLYSLDLSEQLEIVEVNWVMGHFARWSISQNHVVLSLSHD
ncbi:hypothetical protein K439DRAFT_1649726 [Ramaria rubella]|nr:hypothetical protein K439DRAFT_1649726 [Ramaria rubella]